MSTRARTYHRLSAMLALALVTVAGCDSDTRGPADAKPADAKPADAKPADTKPADPVDVKTADASADDSSSADSSAEPAETGGEAGASAADSAAEPATATANPGETKEAGEPDATAADSGGDETGETPATAPEKDPVKRPDKTPVASKPTGPVNVLVLREKTAGGAAAAQGYVDKIVAAAAKINGWSESAGKYTTSRATANAYIGASKPMFGIMSLAAFLALRKQHGLSVIGQADVSAKGGRQYHLVSKSEGSLAGCKGKTLASNHLDDRPFVDGVVSGGEFKLSDFTLDETRRPVQTLKKVIDGEAACALIDDAQLAEMKGVSGGEALKSVWKSKELPPMAVVAFSSAPAGVRTAFKSSLAKICAGAGASACGQAGITRLKPASDSAYKAVISAYK